MSFAGSVRWQLGGPAVGRDFMTSLCFAVRVADGVGVGAVGGALTAATGAAVLAVAGADEAVASPAKKRALGCLQWWT